MHIAWKKTNYLDIAMMKDNHSFARIPWKYSCKNLRSSCVILLDSNFRIFKNIALFFYVFRTRLYSWKCKFIKLEAGLEFYPRLLWFQNQIFFINQQFMHRLSWLLVACYGRSVRRSVHWSIGSSHFTFSGFCSLWPHCSLHGLTLVTRKKCHGI